MADQEQRKHLVKLYFDLGMEYKDIVILLSEQHGITITERHLKRVLVNLNLHRRRYSDLSDVVQFVVNELKGSGQLHGYRIMHTKCQEAGLCVRKDDIRFILRELDPEGVDLRRSRRLARRTYHARGPNFIWHVDGYDKIKPFGLCISGCIDGFSRKIIWLKVYHTNNNPKVIGGYFIEAVKECSGCPCLVRADYGTENGHVRTFQQLLRRNGTDSLNDNSYIDGASTANQRIECWWGFLRKECMQYWIDLFKNLQHRGLHGGDFLHKNLSRFCFMASVQVSEIL